MARSRAQSETVGIVLLTAVFVVLAAIVGLFLLTNLMSEADDGPLVDVEANTTAGYVTVHHGGGDALAVADVSVIVEGASRRQYDLGGFQQRVGDDASRFEPGDSWRHSNDVGGERLTISVVDRSANEIVDTVTVTLDVDVVARFSYQPSSPAPGEVVTFDGGGSEVEGSTIDTYEWDFDDDGATEASGETAQYTFGSTGTYPVSLQVTTADGRTASTTDYVRVESGGPTASFTYSPSEPTTQDDVTFDASGSSGGGSSISSYEWDYDDGTTGSGVQPTHRYADNGSYAVTLTVTNADGATSSTTRTVQVDNVAPTVAFETRLEDADNDGDDEIVYDASASSDPDGSVDRYRWDIDDDGTVEIDTTDPVAVEETVFVTTGDVTLTVSDDDGATSTSTQGGEYQPTPGFEVFAVVLAILAGAALRRRGYLRGDG